MSQRDSLPRPSSTHDRAKDAQKTLWALASRLAEAGESEQSKLGNLVHYAWQEAYEVAKRTEQDGPPTVEELFTSG